MPNLTRRTALLALAPALLSRPQAALAAAEASTAIPGIYALPEGTAKVSATLTVSPGLAGARLLDIRMTQLDGTRPITRYDTELTKLVHVIAVSADFRTFVHEHGERLEAGGHFRLPVPFPRRGPWHIYADATPTGLGQQVMRFDVDLDKPGAVPAPAPADAQPPTLQPTGPDGSDGRYTARFETLDLLAGQDAELSLRILRDGQPAPDVTPYLGVAAHVVLISTTDLTYVHVHASEAQASTMPLMNRGAAPGAPRGHDAMPGMGASSLSAGARVSSEMKLHLHAPKAGIYAMWLQFSAGGTVRTVPFVVSVR
jgi:hypothetical protein